MPMPCTAGNAAAVPCLVHQGRGQSERALIVGQPIIADIRSPGLRSGIGARIRACYSPDRYAVPQRRERAVVAAGTALGIMLMALLVGNRIGDDLVDLGDSFVQMGALVLWHHAQGDRVPNRRRARTICSPAHDW